MTKFCVCWHCNKEAQLKGIFDRNCQIHWLCDDCSPAFIKAEDKAYNELYGD